MIRSAKFGIRVALMVRVLLDDDEADNTLDINTE